MQSWQLQPRVGQLCGASVSYSRSSHVGSRTVISCRSVSVCATALKSCVGCTLPRFQFRESGAQTSFWLLAVNLHHLANQPTSPHTLSPAVWLHLHLCNTGTWFLERAEYLSLPRSTPTRSYSPSISPPHPSTATPALQPYTRHSSTTATANPSSTNTTPPRKREGLNPSPPPEPNRPASPKTKTSSIIGSSDATLPSYDRHLRLASSDHNSNSGGASQTGSSEADRRHSSLEHSEVSGTHAGSIQGGSAGPWYSGSAKPHAGFEQQCACRMCCFCTLTAVHHSLQIS